ncbi:SAV_2336 N-terminal domain-related protein [Actinoplanes sp. NPDC026623]|uniref:SAV_2336 N-terminal domain-related protein n=1 Tax=Actinoplanes sp. NPDC026623 TaxID=3155610 RepID=UPI0033C45F55
MTRNIDQVRVALQECGFAAAPQDLADLVWLARFLPGPQEGAGPAAPSAPPDRAPPAAAGSEVVSSRPPPAEAAAQATPVYLASRRPRPGREGTTVRISPAPALVRRLALQRALRPFRRWIPDPVRPVFDEDATADLAARRSLAGSSWLPVLRPGARRAFDLLLVVDTSESMVMWHRMVADLAGACTETGFFGTVTTLALDAKGTLREYRAEDGAGRPVRGRASGSPFSPGRRVTLVFSDCCGGQWHGPAQRTLLALARGGPVAVLQPLPERLWARTSAPVSIGRLTPPAPGAPSSTSIFVAQAAADSAAHRAVAPVIEMTPAALLRWATMVAGGTPLVPAAVIDLSPAEALPSPPGDDTTTDVKELVRRFVAAASAGAIRLMRCVAITTPALPVMHLLQQTVLGRSAPTDIAEVVLSRLLRPSDEDPETYSFIPGAREELLRNLGRGDAADTVDVLIRVARRIDSGRRAPGLEPIRVLIAQGTSPDAVAEDRPFALIDSGVLNRLMPRRLTAPAGPNPRFTAVSAILTVSLAPWAIDPHRRFLFSAVLHNGGQQRSVASSDDPQRLDDVRHRVNALLDEVVSEVDPEQGRMAVEFVLPRVLITEPVSEWASTGPLGLPIGDEFLVTLRSYERLRQPRTWPQWSAKWRLAQGQLRPDAAALLYLGRGDRTDPRRIFEELSADDKLALVLGGPLPRQAELQPYDPLAAALQAGIPYVFWLRDPAREQEFRRAVQRAASEMPIRDLPYELAGWRTTGDRLGRQVSMIVCDYDRRSPSDRGLIPPRRRTS